MQWKGLWYIDKTAAFGVRLGAHFYCRATNAVCSIVRRRQNPMFAYIDNFIGWKPTLTLALKAFAENREVLGSLGLQESVDKETVPATTVTWVGVTFNSVNMTMSIPRDKIREVLDEMQAWSPETIINLKELQKLLGRIFHATKCCINARLFCNRLLDGLRVAYRNGHTPITNEMRMDLNWLTMFLTHFNGVHLIRSPQQVETIYVDLCLTAGGAIWGRSMYTAVYTPAIVSCGWHISQLEVFNLLLAIRWWQLLLKNRNVDVYCDNAATVTVLQSGRSADPLMRACTREVWLLAFLNDISITAKHMPGRLNGSADILSRAHLSQAAASALLGLQISIDAKAVPLPHTFVGSTYVYLNQYHSHICDYRILLL